MSPGCRMTIMSPVLAGLAVVIVLSQVGLAKTSQPICQSLPAGAQRGAASLVLADLQIVVHMLRLTASARALCIPFKKSLLTDCIALRLMNAVSDGAARLAKMAAIAITTSSSISVNPRCNLGSRDFEFIRLV